MHHYRHPHERGTLARGGARGRRCQCRRQERARITSDHSASHLSQAMYLKAYPRYKIRNGHDGPTDLSVIRTEAPRRTQDFYPTKVFILCPVHFPPSGAEVSLHGVTEHIRNLEKG